MIPYDLISHGLRERRKIRWKVLREVIVCLFLLFALLQFLSFYIASVYSQSSSLLVFAEAPSFARLEDIDPTGWFYQAVLYNPTDNDIVVTGLRWWYNASAGVDFIDGVRNVQCYDSRYFLNLPTVWVSGPDDVTRWEYINGTITITVPAKEIIVTWIEVPTNSRNNEGIVTTYYVEACVGSQWISSPLYVSHAGHDKICSTVFRADFDLTTDPSSENHSHPNPEWLFEEDRSVIANLSTRVRVIPVTSSRNTNGIDFATINVTLPSGWSYMPGSAYNPYDETITLCSVDGKDRLKWNLDNNVYRYSGNQSMAQNYIEFNVTAPHIASIYNFTVTSMITSLIELRTTIETQHIYAVVKTPPNATFTYSPTTPLTGENVTFNATSSLDLDGQIVGYFWDFGDGNTSTDNIATHSYADNGTYTVTLTTTDNDGLNDTALGTITVQNRPPIAQFTESAEIVDTDVVIYFNASESYDLDGFVVSYVWDFGDDANSTGALVNHTYADDGIYTVVLTVTDDDGATASANTTKTILNRPPVAIFTESAETVYTHELIYFNASDSYDPDGTIISHFWDFGDRTNATGKVVSHAYLDNGNYTVTLVVTDGDGATDSFGAIKTVLNRFPVALFAESTTTVYTGEIIYFYASDSYDPDGYIVNHFWDFGDGTNATGVTVSHAYAEDGSFAVNLTVTDDDGSLVVATHVLTILNRAPVASFIIFPQQLVADDSVTFNAMDSYDPDGTIVNCIWDFGDGNITATSSGVITHTYHEYGDFNVTLTMVDNDGYNNTTSQIVTVHVHDIAILNTTVSQTEVLAGQVVNITVTVKNEGTTTESFNVTVFRNDTLIGMQLVSNLAPNAEKILEFYWNTIGMTPNTGYAICAEASAVAGETDIFDNTYSCGTVKVESQGPPPFDWGPIIPYVAPIGSAVIAVILVIAAKKELLGLLLGALGGLSWLKKRKRRKGFEFFDEMTDRGIPDSFSVLISGEPGSGKSVLCQQLTHTFLTRGNSCIYATYDSFPNEVRENMEKFHWNISKYENEGKLVFIDPISSIAKTTSKEKYSVNRPFSLSDLGITMSQATNETVGPPRMFLDSTVPLLTHVAPSNVVEFLQDRGIRIKGVEGTFIFTVGKETIEPNLISQLEEGVDCVIELEVSKGKTVRRMRVKKMRGRKTSGKWNRFEIDSGKGIVFLV
jgi:PKD repeat protein/KaiC/GvpD/RAD55 family RecA-like ATPase